MTALAAELEPEEIPAGTYWPGPDTLVLLNRPLRPGTDPARLSRFRDQRWDLNAAVFADHTRACSINFALIPENLQLTTKHYIWQILNHPDPPALRAAKSTRIVISTITTSFNNYLQVVMRWLADQHVTELCQVTPELLDALLLDLQSEDIPLPIATKCLSEVRRLWSYREILPAGMRLPATPPWDGEDTGDLLQGRRTDRENRTRRIGEATMEMLLCWAVRFIEDFADDIVAAFDEYIVLLGRTPEGRRAAGTQIKKELGQVRHVRGELIEKVTCYLQGLRDRGEGLPAVRADGEEGELRIRWRHLAAVLDCGISFQYTGAGRLIRESGLPLVDARYLDPPITGRLDGRPWRENRITFDEAPRLARLLSTAGFIVVAYLSGARPGEVLNLRRGCIRQDPKTNLWLMDGLYFKGAVDKHGNTIPEGTLREDPWVVIELVADAVKVLERLHPHNLLFPSRLDHRRQGRRVGTFRGQARSDQGVSDDIQAFVDWINTECTSRGRSDRIPDDGRGTLKPSRLRRTLAWFIRRRPRGLIAAAMQYGHAHTRMVQGYAGTYESGFVDDYAFEDWLYRLECLADDEEALQTGEHVSGPAADAYRHRVTAAGREFAGRVLTSTKQARDLVGNPLLQIHHGEGMTCVLNPETAACQLRGAADDPLVTPDIDDCRPKCPNLARTDRDIEHVRQKASELAVIVADPLAPPIRHQRDLHELSRLEAIIDAHQQGAQR